MNSEFVIQKHTRGRNSHYDFMLQKDDVLLTWRTQCEPKELGNGSAEMIRIFDHPRRFIEYEGPVNQGEGQVQIQDKGPARIEKFTDDIIIAELTGKIVKGRLEIKKIEQDKWRLKKT